MKDKQWNKLSDNEREKVLKIIKGEKEKDVFGDDQKGYMKFECNTQMTVSELKVKLEKYPDAVIFMESSNSYNRGYKNINWSQKVLDTYPCKDSNNNLALMIVGSVR